MVEAARQLPRNDRRSWKQKGTEEKEWDPAREERESPSPKGKDKCLAPTKTQDVSPNGEKSKSKSGHRALTTNKREQLPIRRKRQGKAGNPSSRP